MQYNTVNYSHYSVCYIPMTYFITRTLYQVVPSTVLTTSSLPIATINLFFILMLLKQDKNIQVYNNWKIHLHLLWLYHRVVLMKYKQMILINNLGERIQWGNRLCIDAMVLPWWQFYKNSWERATAVETWPR